MRRPLVLATVAALLAAAAPAAAADAVSGHWAVSGHDAGHDFTLACVFAQAGQNLSGECVDGPTGDSKIKGGRHIRYAPETPMNNLLLSMLDKAGVPTESLGDSTGTLQHLSDV